MATFKLDGKDIPFEPGESIIKAAYRQGIEIPHYCWHPGLSAPANCRMCLVEIKPAANQRAVMLDVVEWDEKAGDYRPVQKPKLLPACQMAAVEGQEVQSDTSANVKQARAHVQEFLLLNHPVDCPICDQAGECKLQDYWLEHQGTQKRMRDEPVHKPKGVSFGPTIVYDGERCVMCTRCVRFMDEVAKDPVLTMRERGNLNEITVAPGRELTGNYTFMTEHVCPVGALTTKDFRFKARVWFLRSAKSICQGCATGCNAHLDYDPRNNKAYRYRPRDNEAVNKYWMCDEGMLSYNRISEARLDGARVRNKSASTKDTHAEIKKVFGSVAREQIAFLLSAQHSLEDNWALRELARVLHAPMLYWAGNADGASDNVLMHKDKNPNTRGVRQLVPEAKDFKAFLDDARAGRFTHVIALGSATPTQGTDEASTLGMLTGLLTISAHTDSALVELANAALPATAWAEQNGTFTNKDGLAQVAQKATEPTGSAKPAWQHVVDLAQIFEVDLGVTKLKEIHARWDEPVTQPDVTAQL
jgi:NADH-quinone oxidoreductase subunit G